MLNTEIITHDYNHNEIWTKILARLKAELGEDICNSWFARVKIAKQEADTVYLTVPTPVSYTHLTLPTTSRV